MSDDTQADHLLGNGDQNPAQKIDMLNVWRGFMGTLDKSSQASVAKYCAFAYHIHAIDKCDVSSKKHKQQTMSSADWDRY